MPEPVFRTSHWEAVGRIEPNAAQVWMRVRQPGRFVCRWWPEGEENAAEQHPFEIPADNERDTTWVAPEGRQRLDGSDEVRRLYHHRVKWRGDRQKEGRAASKEHPEV